MVKTRKERKAEGGVKLRQPDRSAPSEKTLLDFADERNLFQQAAKREKELKQNGNDPHDSGDSDDDDDDDGEVPVLSPAAERILEAALWTVTIAMLHFTFDVLVQHQYGTEIKWSAVGSRTATAWGVFLFLFYFLHPHESNAVLIYGMPLRYQRPLRQAVFFVASVVAGCYLIHISNRHGYLATMKQAPPLGCLWLWAVVELDLVWGCTSLLIAAVFLQLGGYDLK
ncbi:hypothetical protein QQS21_012703 [Conoideocrella luteorostrata]|uniref:DUF7719 domain-containing protein n=1 Tax=Conoideocrella luteorostrata TaxID=1105319 RepID=A0AAJ0FM37_9HYPO|nr:hypothetical protein QQS21_012703 [Conoideocrella luteorostrata]